MSVFITGDIHGENSVRRLAKKNFDEQNLTRDDFVIILGDFGFVWSDPPAPSDTYWLDWLEDKPWTTLFIDGNHDNHDVLAAMPAEDWHGGKIHRIRNHVLHLMRGYIFDLNGKTWFTMGGARSHDIEYRKEGKSWWKAEIPSHEERIRAIDTLADANHQVDFILTHQPPTLALQHFIQKFPDIVEDYEPDEYADWLQHVIADETKFTRWFYGHMHKNCYWNSYYGVYDIILRID